MLSIGAANISDIFVGDERIVEAYVGESLVYALVSKYFDITLLPNRDAYGTVSGGGVYQARAQVTATATPETGYKFVHWVEVEGDTDTVVGAAEIGTAEIGG